MEELLSTILPGILQRINDFSTDHAWVGFIGVLLISFQQVCKAARDAFDTTPETDDNLFERAVTIMNKIAAYVTIGQRPKPPQEKKDSGNG